MGDSWAGLFWIFLLFAWLAWWLAGPADNEVVQYSASCSNGKSIVPLSFARKAGLSFEQLRDNRTNCEIVRGGTVRFSVDRTSGTVVYRTGDMPWINKLTDCEILDAENWHCAYSDGSGHVGFLDGQRTFFEEDIGLERDFYVKRWQYALMHLPGQIGGPLLIPQQKEQFPW